MQTIVKKIFESKQFEWKTILDKLKKIDLILLEVLIIGMRYYPLMGILDKHSLVCLILACVYIWFDLVYNIAITGLCEGLKLSVSFDFLKDIRRVFGVGFIYDAQEYLKSNIGGNILKNGFKSDVLHQKSDQFGLDINLLFSSNRIWYTIIKSLPHFFCLSYVTIKLSASCVKMVHKKIFGKKRREIFKDDYYGQKYVVNMSTSYDLVYTKIYNQLNKEKHMPKSFEDRYVKNLFQSTPKQSKNFSNKYFGLLIDANFRFSTRIICTYTVCFTVLFNFNCFLIFYGSVFLDMIFLPPFYKNSLFFSALMTSSTCTVQLINYESTEISLDIFA